MSAPSDECTVLALFDDNAMNEEKLTYIEKEVGNEYFAEDSSPAPYIGLCNQGATCYMNSVLQTLFMTPEFRKGIYSWTYNKDVHGKEEDSIMLQLQKLFAKLQMKFTNVVDTKDLTKSFQWNAGESFEQQDIQEFCRVLFDVIEQSCKNSQAQNFISELYEGTSVNYVKCSECGYESKRHENFLDVCLTVKNKIDKIYNDSLEKAVQSYLKPESLDGQNKYSCEICNKKVDAKRGTQFVKMPKILCVILNRFSFDYFSMKRVKLNDLVSFPFVLNFNDYINGYDNIKNKMPEETDSSVFAEDKVYKPAVPLNNKPIAKPKATINSNPIKKNTNKIGSAQTKDFLKEMRSKKKENSKDNDDNIEIFEMNSNMIQEAAIPLPPPPPPPLPIEEFLTHFEFDRPQLPPKRQLRKTNSQPSDLFDEIKQFHHSKFNAPLSPSMKAQISKNLSLFNSSCSSAITNYLKDGPLVYELFSILVHTGGAYGGHYYNFTKSFETGAWYKFDDSTVTEVDVSEISEKVFGGNNCSNTAYMLQYRKAEDEKDENQNEKLNEKDGEKDEENGEKDGKKDEKDGKKDEKNEKKDEKTEKNEKKNEKNKKKDEKNEKKNEKKDENLSLRKIEIPEFIFHMMENEKREEDQKRQEKIENLKNIIVKVYYKLEVKGIPIHLDYSYKDLLGKCLEAYELETKPHNARLRDYSSATDTLLACYDGKEDQKLSELKIFNDKIMGLEVKKENEFFEEYDSNKIKLRTMLWTNEMEDMDVIEIEERIIKFECYKTDTLGEIHKKIASIFKVDPSNLVLLRKVVTAGFSIAFALKSPVHMSKTLSELIMIENAIIYAELTSDPETFESVTSHWQSEFDRESNYLSIKFNNPLEKSTKPELEYSYTLAIDSRSTLNELKIRMLEILSLSPDEYILKRGGKLGMELKDLNSTISSQHFVNGSSVYIEKGTPSKPGQYRILFYLARKTSLMSDNFFYSFEELFELPIPGEWTVSKVKELVLENLIMKKNITHLNMENIRLRERNSEKLTKIYREMPMCTQQLYERRMIAVEEIEQAQNLKFKEIMINIRIWDAASFELGARIEMNVNKDWSLKEIAEEIRRFNDKIEAENMAACRILSIMRFNPMNLVYEEWFDMNTTDLTASQHPFYLNTDGFLIIIKDKTIPIRELTEEEMKKMGIISSNKIKFEGVGKATGTGTQRTAPLEKALKITLKKNEENMQK